MGYAVGQTVQLTVQEMTPQWEGIGELEKIPVLLEGTVWVGDEVKAVLTARSRQHGHWFARVRRVVVPGVQREPLFCNLASACGGCHGGGIPYEVQTTWKATYLQKLFPTADFVSSPQSVGYRNKVKWIVGYDTQGRVQLGFYRPKSHTFLPIQRCAQLIPELVQLEIDLLELLQDIQPYDEVKNTGDVKSVFAKSNSRGEILVTFVVAHPLNTTQTAILKQVIRLPYVVGVTCNLQSQRTNRLTGDTEWGLAGAEFLVEPDWPLPFYMNATGFSQVNHDIAKAAVQKIVNELRGVQLPIFDLYCGTGPIALALLSAGHDVIGVEIQPKAIELAYKSSARIDWHNCDADSFLQSFHHGPSAFVVNPPRTGLSAFVIKRLGELPVMHLVYMSCNPKTLQRDAVILQQYGFYLASITGFDMFAQTPWFETVAHFIRKKMDC